MTFQDSKILKGWYKLQDKYKKKIDYYKGRGGRINDSKLRLYEYLLELVNQYIKEESKKPIQLEIW